MTNFPAALRGTALAAAATLALAAPALVFGAPAVAAAPAAPAFAAAPAGLPAAPAAAHAPAAVPVRPALPATPPAPPQGALSPTGCTVTGTSAVCELWAKTGQLVLPGAAAPVPIWGFASTVDAPATVPGPLLVVDQGAQVTLNVHNGLTRNLSLAVPTLTGLAPDRTGVSTGGVATYTFNATRPGTYLYEAGHTADGARQAAMGLVGALVVRGANVGGQPTAYGSVDSAYQDEAVLVLTEVDPAFNASPDPLGFDLRKFNPKYRLINGKAFPETDPVATDVGRRVLLRYVDAGIVEHAMTVLGADQSIVGQDARATVFPEGAVTVPLRPGQVADAVVALPGGPDGRRFMVYESGGLLNNAGQRYGTAQPGVSQQQAFGGMLTYLDTNPAAPSGDHVGPVSTRVLAAPDPASVAAPVTVTADFTDVPNGNSTVDAAEVVIDDLSIAEGTGVPFTSAAFGTGPTVTGATATLTPAMLGVLSQGRHTLWVRAHDVNGNWGVVNSTTVTLAVTGAVTTGLTAAPNPTHGLNGTTVAIAATGDDRALGGTVTAAEYFLDTVGDNGSGAAMALDQSGAPITGESATIPAATVAGLTEGRHTVLVHTQDSFGFWGPIAGIDLVIDRTAPTLVSGAVVPAVTNGSTGSPADPGDLRVDAAFTDAVAQGVNSPIAAAEGFIDTAGADGTGFVFFALDGAFNTATESTYGLVPLSELTRLADGTHQMLVHARDAAGNWGPLVGVAFTVDRTGPVVTAATASPNPATGPSFALTATASDARTGIAAAEWFEGTDPGAGLGTAMTVTATGATTANLSATVSGLANGTHTLRLRARDAAGNWGATASVTVTVNRSTAIFADGFDTGTTSAWSTSVGGPAVARSAAFGNSFALTVSGVAPRYVVDNRPAAETTLHAQFQFAAGTYNTRNAVMDLFQARNGGNAAVLVVQYRRTTAGVSQLRIGALTAAGWRYSGWVTIGTGATTVRADWAAAAAGTTTLSVNGAPVASVTGNTSAWNVESAALGVVAGTGTITGAGAIDNYTSNR